jgi:hypothetical protein
MITCIDNLLYTGNTFLVCTYHNKHLTSSWYILTNQYIFYVHGSVHLGKIYVQLKFQLDVLFMYSLFFFILSSTCFGCYLHPSSGAQL